MENGQEGNIDKLQLSMNSDLFCMGKIISEPMGKVSVLIYCWFVSQVTPTAPRPSAEVAWFARKLVILNVIAL